MKLGYILSHEVSLKLKKKKKRTCSFTTSMLEISRNNENHSIHWEKILNEPFNNLWIKE